MRISSPPWLGLHFGCQRGDMLLYGEQMLVDVLSDLNVMNNKKMTMLYT